MEQPAVPSNVYLAKTQERVVLHSATPTFVGVINCP